MSMGICPGGCRTAHDYRRQKSMADPMVGRKGGGRKWHRLWTTMWVLGLKPRFHKAASPLTTEPSPQPQWWILDACWNTQIQESKMSKYWDFWNPSLLAWPQRPVLKLEQDFLSPKHLLYPYHHQSLWQVRVFSAISILRMRKAKCREIKSFIQGHSVVKKTM